MYSDFLVNLSAAVHSTRAAAHPKLLPNYALLVFLLLALGLSIACRGARAGEPGRIHWGSVDQAQVKVDQTTPLTWGVYQAQKKDKPDKKLSNLVLVLIGHRYLLVDLKGKQVYEVPIAEVQKQDDGLESGDLAASSRALPTSDWTWRNVGPAELYHVTLGDYGLVLQITLPHPYLISPYF
ncbi:MAG: hypothetical protein KGL75_03105 [Acidobacteriota bacterium]|nr:hypothetical protein [Acidobacteriota bacterium]